jgi:outer membrane protein assembly factor BamA
MRQIKGSVDIDGPAGRRLASGQKRRIMHRFLSLTSFLVLAALASASPSAARASDEEPMKTGAINIYGNHKIKTYVIRRVIPLRTGEIFDPEKVNEARRRLREIPGVDYSEIRVTYSLVDSALSLNVVVTEKSAFHGDPLVQRGPENKFSFGLWVSEDNFRGRSETLGGSAMFYGGTVADVLWEDPWLGQGPRIGIGFSGRYANYKYVYDDLGGAFEGARIERYSGRFSLFYTFWSGFRLVGTAAYAAADGDRDGVTNKTGGDRFPIYSLGLHYDARGSRLWPWSGWFLDADVSAVGPGQASYSIVNGRLDARAFLPVFNRTVLALQFSPSVNDGDRIPVYMREHIGGGTTIRSYDYGEFNAQSAVVTGVEYRIPINFDRRSSVEDKLFAASIHLFADAGAAWESGQSLDEGDLWHAGYGLGILLLNAWFRGLRFDYGWHEGSNGMFHFEIGAKF